MIESVIVGETDYYKADSDEVHNLPRDESQLDNCDSFQTDSQTNDAQASNVLWAHRVIKQAAIKQTGIKQTATRQAIVLYSLAGSLLVGTFFTQAAQTQTVQTQTVQTQTAHAKQQVQLDSQVRTAQGIQTAPKAQTETAQAEKTAQAGTAQAERRILVIHSYHDHMMWTSDLRNGIEQGFSDLSDEVSLYHEFLDAKRLPALTHGEAFLEQLKVKYPASSLDMLIVSDNPGLSLILENREKYFPTLPIVYLGINTIDPALLEVPNITGVFELHSIIDTVLGALKQHNSEHLIVINDSTETGQANLDEINLLRQHPDAPTHITIINDATLLEAQAAIKGLREDCPVLLLGQLRQVAEVGALISFEQTTKYLREAIPNPLYSVTTKAVGHGIVGGNVLDPEYHASQAVDLAQKVLDQGDATQIEPITKGKTRWVFDYRELQRFGLALNDLPMGSKIVHRDPSFYSQYKKLVWLTLSIFSIGLLVILLLAEVIRRRGIAANLLKENEKRYRDLAETGASVFWELNKNAEFTYISDEALALDRQQPTRILGRSLHAVVSRDETLDFDWGEFLQAFYRHQPIQDFIFRRRDRIPPILNPSTTAVSANTPDNNSSNNSSNNPGKATGSGKVRIFKINGKPMFDDSQNFLGYRGIQREITQEYELAETLAYQATHDWLTGLVNRYEFDDCLKRTTQMIAQNDSDEQTAVLCYIDLDQFKIINDTAGHFVGDRLLVDIANIFRTHIRESDTLSRLGGDEFGLILKNCSVKTATEICTAIISALQAYRFEWEQRQFAIGCSIGLVAITANLSESADLLSRADLACYKAKELGRGRLYVDVPGETGLDSDQSVMTHIASLHQSLEEQKFFLVQQKIQALSATTELEHHFEVLIRFRDKTNTVMSPADFIPAMEQYGVITIVDRWVLETVLNHSCEQTEEQAYSTLISINISGISLSDESFLDYAVYLLKQSKLPATSLCFEITETAAISHLTGAKKFIHTLKDMGARFALDDFGSGLSSFGYLKSLPVDFLKIDGSLVKHMLREPSDLAIVKCVNDIAHTLGMQTIAEFVEDEATSTCLKQLGVDYVQGYGIEKPKLLFSDGEYASVKTNPISSRQ